MTEMIKHTRGERIPFPIIYMAPFVSEMQRRKFAELVKQGKMKQSTFDEWNKDTPVNIPERKGQAPGAPAKPRTIEELKSIAKKKLGK